MDVKELIAKINKSVDELDFVTSRVYIEENIAVLKDNQVRLNSNARELYKFLASRIEAGIQPISRQDMAIIHAINSCATKFDLRGIKIIIKDKAQLLLRQDIIDYFNADAKIILEGMGAISTKKE